MAFLRIGTYNKNNMTKIMLVEDDKSLREIYGVRLLAEGYDIVSAGDGEEALAMAIKERPVLIVTDVMMPRISGFDMLDILRSTTETKNIKVIMMTALSSEDQRKHGEQLGADRYLVKSQVGIEDVVRVVHEVLGDSAAPVAPAPAAAAAPQNPVSAAAPIAPPAPAPQPVVSPLQRPVAAQPRAATPPQAAAPQVESIARPAPAPAATIHAPLPPSGTVAAPSTRQRVIQPINDPTSKIDINNLLDKELAREAGVDVNSRPNIATTEQERAFVEDQLRNAIPPAPVPQPQQPAAPQAPAPITEPEPAPPIPQRPPVQPPQRPNVAPMQPRQDSVPPVQ
jgi:CheY-like chemotaxis protein